MSNCQSLHGCEWSDMNVVSVEKHK